MFLFWRLSGFYGFETFKTKDVGVEFFTLFFMGLQFDDSVPQWAEGSQLNVYEKGVWFRVVAIRNFTGSHVLPGDRSYVLNLVSPVQQVRVSILTCKGW